MIAARFAGSGVAIGMRDPGTFFDGAARYSLSVASSQRSFDAFSAGNSDPALIDYLYNQGTAVTVGTLYDVQANVTGDLGKYGITSPFAEQGLAVALGAEYRKDTLKSRAWGQSARGCYIPTAEFSTRA